MTDSLMKKRKATKAKADNDKQKKKLNDIK